VRLSIIVATAENGVIGGDGKLLWRIRDDLAWFKKHTMGKPMIMGRKTFDSIGKPLPGRDSIILTRDPAFQAPGGFIVRSLRGAMSLAEDCAAARGAEEACVIGGGEIYAQTIERAERIYLTRVHAEIPGDTVFPPIDSRQWDARPAGGCEKNAQNEHACEFFILDRSRP
jgi:dihydrofolate reductase